MKFQQAFVTTMTTGRRLLPVVIIMRFQNALLYHNHVKFSMLMTFSLNILSLFAIFLLILHRLIFYNKHESVY